MGIFNPMQNPATSGFCKVLAFGGVQTFSSLGANTLNKCGPLESRYSTEILGLALSGTFAYVGHFHGDSNSPYVQEKRTISRRVAEVIFSATIAIATNEVQ